MPEREEELHELAVAIIEDCGDEAHAWTLRRAALLRREGVHARAEFWERVAAMVASIQRGLEKRRYH
jgi:hypothetical protein